MSPFVTEGSETVAIGRDDAGTVRRYYYRRPGSNRLVVVPVHAGKIVPPETLLAILRQAELNVNEPVELLKA